MLKHRKKKAAMLAILSKSQREAERVEVETREGVEKGGQFKRVKPYNILSYYWRESRKNLSRCIMFVSFHDSSNMVS